MPIKMRSTANKSTTQRMNPSWQSRNFAWSGCAYNHTRPSEHAKREQLLKEMLAECGAGCWIEPPFHAN